MSVLARLMGAAPRGERRAWQPQTLADLDKLMDMNLGQSLATAAGRAVSPQTALGMSAVWACVRVLSETVASLPLPIFRRLEGGGKARAPEHPLYAILHDRPNPEMTSFELREALMGHLALWGNAYCEIQRDAYTGDVTALWPLRPDRMSVARLANELVYEYRLADGSPRTFDRNMVLHLRGLSHNGITGYSPIEVAAREAIGLGLAAEQFGAGFFGNGARPGMVLQHPGVLGDDAHKRLRESWEHRHQGLDNAHRVAILEEGMTIETIGIPPDAAQFLETRKFQVTEIARIFRIPPHLVGDLDRATFSNIEQQAIEFVMHTVRPWTERIEQRMEASLIAPAERGRFFVEHVIDGILRGDIQSRYAAYAVGRQWGWFSVNDIRAMENMNPVAEGDEYLVPMNMTEASRPVDQETGNPGTRELADRGIGRLGNRQGSVWEQRSAAAVAGRRRVAMTYQPTLQDVAQRVLNRETNDVKQAARRFLKTRDVDGFNRWLEEFYFEHTGFIHRYIAKPMRTYADLVAMHVEQEVGKPTDSKNLDEQMDAYVEARANEWAALHRREIQGMMRAETGGQRSEDRAADELLAAVEMRLGHWQETEAEDWSRHQVNQAGNYVALGLYALAGILRKRWRTFGDNCPYCSGMNDRTIELQGAFLAAGSELTPTGANPFRSSATIGHPPLHAGCDCMIVADMSSLQALQALEAAT